MSNVKVKPDKLAGAITDIIQEYSDDVVRSMPELTKQTAKDCVKNLKSEAKGAGIGGTKYKKSFRYKVVKSNSRITTVKVYSTQYQLTHLLEFGHVVRNRPGGPVLGTARAFPHWAEAEKKANRDLEEKITQRITL